jgi:hypothetical protein
MAPQESEEAPCSREKKQPENSAESVSCGNHRSKLRSQVADFFEHREMMRARPAFRRGYISHHRYFSEVKLLFMIGTSNASQSPLSLWTSRELAAFLSSYRSDSLTSENCFLWNNWTKITRKIEK